MSKETGPTGHEPKLEVGSWFWIDGIPFRIVELARYSDKPPKLVAKSSSELLLIEQAKTD